MAEIRIQEKRRPVWPWILLILILIAAAILLYWYLNRNGNGRETYESAPPDTTEHYSGDTTQTEAMEPGDEVDQFTTFTEQDTGEFSKEYVHTGLNLMAGAVSNIVSKGDTAGSNLKSRADSLMSYTLNITDTTDRSFSGKISRSFTTTFDILNTIHRKNYPDLMKQMNDLRSAARAFDPTKNFNRQQSAVQNYFRIAGSILSNMKNTARAI